VLVSLEENPRRADNRGNGDFVFSYGLCTLFLHLFLTGLLVAVLTMVGLVCLLLPGVYLAVTWSFALALAADKRPRLLASDGIEPQDGLEALVASVVAGARAGRDQFRRAIGFGIGVFITAPITLAALMYAYEDIFGSRKAFSHRASATDSAACPRLVPLTLPMLRHPSMPHTNQQGSSQVGRPSDYWSPECLVS